MGRLGGIWGEEPAASLLPTVAARGRSPSWKSAGRARGWGSRVLAPRAVAPGPTSRVNPGARPRVVRRGQELVAGVGRGLSAPGVPGDPLPLRGAGAGRGVGGGLQPSHLLCESP